MILNYLSLHFFPNFVRCSLDVRNGKDYVLRTPSRVGRSSLGHHHKTLHENNPLVHPLVTWIQHHHHGGPVERTITLQHTNIQSHTHVHAILIKNSAEQTLRSFLRWNKSRICLVISWMIAPLRRLTIGRSFFCPLSFIYLIVLKVPLFYEVPNLFFSRNIRVNL